MSFKVYCLVFNCPLVEVFTDFAVRHSKDTNIFHNSIKSKILFSRLDLSYDLLYEKVLNSFALKALINNRKNLGAF